MVLKTNSNRLPSQVSRPVAVCTGTPYRFDVSQSILPVFFAGWPLLLLPIHIVFLELIINPTCSLIFEVEQPETDVMRRPPRPRKEGLFSRRTLGIALSQGLSILAVCLGVFLLGRRNHSPGAARALTFAALVIAFLVVILVNRSWTRPALSMLRDPSKALRWVLLGAAGFLAVALWFHLLDDCSASHHFTPMTCCSAWGRASCACCGWRS